MEKDEAWSTGRQYFNMKAYVEWEQEQTAMMANELQQAAVRQPSRRVRHVLHISPPEGFLQTRKDLTCLSN